MSIRINKRSSNSPQSMPKRAETTEVSIGEVQTYIVLCGEGTLIPQWGWMEQGGMNSVVMSIRGLLSSELWVPTLPVVPVSSSWNQMVPGGSGGSGGSGDSENVGFDWSYQSRIWKWYFVKFSRCLQDNTKSCTEGVKTSLSQFRTLISEDEA